MKTKRLVLISVLFVAVFIVASLPTGISNYRKQSEFKKIAAALQALPQDRIFAAMEAFSRDRKASGSPLPATVSFRELISGGYLRVEDVRGLEDREVSVPLTVNETTPNRAWIRVKLTDGCEAVLSSDGFVFVPAK